MRPEYAGALLRSFGDGVLLAIYLLAELLEGKFLCQLDEMMVAVGLAGLAYATFIFVGTHPNAVKRERQELRAKVDSIYFQSDPCLKSVEHNLEEHDAQTPADIAGTVVGRGLKALAACKNSLEAALLLAYLQGRFDRKRLLLAEQRRLFAAASKPATLHGRRDGLPPGRSIMGSTFLFLTMYAEMKRSLASIQSHDGA